MKKKFNGKAPKKPAIKGEDQWQLSYTSYATPGHFVIRTAKDWNDFWGDKKPGNLPKGAMAVVVCAGQKRSGGHSIKVEDVRSENGKLVLDVSSKGPGGGVATMALTSPLCVKLVPATKDEVVINRLVDNGFPPIRSPRL